MLFLLKHDWVSVHQFDHFDIFRFDQNPIHSGEFGPGLAV
jgi:hypothetical protein